MLQRTLINNGFWLVLRDIINIFIRTFGSFFVMALIEPSIYGQFASIVATFTLLSIIGQMGLNVYIMKAAVLMPIEEETANFIALVNSIVMSAILTGISFFFYKNYLLLMILPIISLFFIIIKMPFLGHVERKIDFKRISQIDINSQLLFYIVTIPSVLIGENKMASLLMGQSMSVLYASIHTIFLSRSKIKIGLNSKKLKDILSFGFNYMISSLSSQMKFLLNIILPNIVGTDLSGKVAFSNRLAETFNIFGDMTRRLSIVGSVRVATPVNFLNKGLLYINICVGSLLCCVILILPHVIEMFLIKWTQIIDLIPFLCIGTLLYSSVPLFSSIFYLKNKIKLVTLFAVIQNSILILSTILVLPRYGLKSYGVCFALSSTFSIVQFFIIKRYYKETKFSGLIIALYYSLLMLFSLYFNYIVLLGFLPLLKIDFKEIIHSIKNRKTA